MYLGTDLNCQKYSYTVMHMHTLKTNSECTTFFFLQLTAGESYSALGSKSL